MPNWCSNAVTFTGEPNRIEQVKALFSAMALKEKEENKGQLPDFVEEDGDWFFDICLEFDSLFYQTRWSPNIKAMQKIGEHFGVGYLHTYIETGNMVYGEATFEEGKLTDIYLDCADFDGYDYDEENDNYVFDGKVYDNSDEILELLLERKKSLCHENGDH